MSTAASAPTAAYRQPLFYALLAAVLVALALTARDLYGVVMYLKSTDGNFPAIIGGFFAVLAALKLLGPATGKTRLLRSVLIALSVYFGIQFIMIIPFWN